MTSRPATRSRRDVIRQRLRGRRLDQRGYAAVLVAMSMAAFLLPITALSVDIAKWYVELERVQTAADAAATAGVTYMPDDFASAQARAIDVSASNGYPNSGTSSVVVEKTTKPSQLKVTVTTKVSNTFAGSFGNNFTTVARSAVADFNGPAPMGSPCNAYGNEPTAAISTDANRGPNTSQIVAPTGGASCTSNPQFWGAIAGPETPKSNGDAFMTRNCTTSVNGAGCSGAVNSEFDPLGYFYIVRVGSGAVGQPMTIQIYDPAFVGVGDKCDDGGAFAQTTGWPWANGMNSYVPTDATTRYVAGNSSAFCNGDVVNGGVASDMVTSFGLRMPTDTYQPKNGTPITNCERQYPGYDLTNTTSQSLTAPTTAKPNASYKPEVAKVFRQWLDLCTFTPTVAGDYYLQIRTNVALGGVSDGEGGYKDNATVFSQSGDDTAVDGTGNNRWAIRVKGAMRSAISVSGFDHMGMYANYAGASTTFNLVRVLPAAASKTLKIGFFDTGDASTAGTLTIQPPPDSNMPASISNCVGAGVVNGTLSGCQLTNVSSGSGYQGNWQYVSVPIPANYSCTFTAGGGCWFTVKFAFPGGVPNDTTTWTAKIDGDPVRLIQ